MRIKKISLTGLHGPDETEIRPFITPSAMIWIQILENMLCPLFFNNTTEAQRTADGLYRGLRNYTGAETFPDVVLVELEFET